MGQGARRVVGEHGIRVNAVEPGWIKTNMSAPMFDAAPEVWKYYIDRIALHRPGEPEEMAGAITFLLSDDASYVTCGDAARRRRLHRQRRALVFAACPAAGSR